MNKDHAQIGLLSYDKMEEIDRIVRNSCEKFADASQAEAAAYASSELIESISRAAQVSLSSGTSRKILLVLLRFARACRNFRLTAGEKDNTYFTGKIIELIQGEIKMSEKLNTVKAVESTAHTRKIGAVAEIARAHPSKSIEDIIEMFREEDQTEYVDRYYEMDPETEDVLPGRFVVEGMRVLVENPLYRNEIPKNDDPRVISEARMRNRWATVEKLHIVRSGETEMLCFVAVYDDGTKRMRTLSLDHAWIVKKDSAPPEPDREYMVIGLHGRVAFDGTCTEILEWLKGLDPISLGFCKVKVGTKETLVNASTFLKDHSVVYSVRDEEGTELYSGTIGQILDWAGRLPGSTPETKYDGYSVTRVGEIDGYDLEQFITRWGAK